MSRSRTTTLVLALVSAAVMAVSVWAMIGRVRGYYESTRHSVPVFNLIDQRDGITFHAVPLTIRDERDEGGDLVVVRFGDRDLRLRPTLKSMSAQVPGLKRHESWLAVMRFVETGGLPGAGTPASPERLVVVVRDPHIALDGTAHGQGRPSDWTFDLHELLPDGTIRTERYGFPLSPRAAREALENPQPVSGVPPLTEGTWQYYAALMTIPRGGRPTPAFTRDAVRAMGWTLPAAVFSGLVLTLSIPWFAALRGRGAGRRG